MKKLVLFFAVVAAISFAACSNANKQEAPAEEASAEVVETPAEAVEAPAVDDSTAVVEAPVAEVAK